MARIFKPTRKRADGTTFPATKWYAEFTNAQGKQKRVPLSTNKAKANQMLQELLARETRIRAGLEQPSHTIASVWLSDVRDAFLRAMEDHLRPKTLRDYRRDLEHLLDGSTKRGPWLLGVKKVEHLTMPEMTKLQQKVLKAGLSPRTANRLVAALSSMMSWALRQGMIPSNPVQGVRNLPTQPKGGRAFEEAEINKLLDASPPDQRDAWVLLLDLGLRRSELASLAVVDYKAGLVTVTAGKSKNKRARSIPATKRVKEILTRRSKGKGPTDPVLDTVGPRNNVYRGLLPMLYRCLEKAGIDSEELNIHSFRRTFITRLLSKGVPPQVVQQLAGHSTVNLTMEIYAKVRADDFQAAIRQLDD